jgi:hypothetical protein
MTMIKVRYSSVDRFSKTRSFKTIEGARKFAHAWVGRHPEIGSSYAVSGDGIGKVTAVGVTLAELFPAEEQGPPAPLYGSQEDEWPTAYEERRNGI